MFWVGLLFLVRFMVVSPDRPKASEYAQFYARYIATVPDGNVIEWLEEQKSTLRAAQKRVTPERETFRYGPGKWTVREIFGHLADAERVFGYRLMCISRGDTTSLPGFDENSYVAASAFNTRPLWSLGDELILVRDANLMMMKALDDEAWRRVGTANNAQISARAIAWIIAGHVDHHLAVLRERYRA